MKVKVRDINELASVAFTECKYSEFHALINFINDSGGVYNTATEEHMPIYTWQLCLDDGETYAEIIVGEE